MQLVKDLESCRYLIGDKVLAFAVDSAGSCCCTCRPSPVPVAVSVFGVAAMTWQKLSIV